jgi:dipeptidase D
MRNVIPREAQVAVTVPAENEKSFLKLVADFETIFNEEYGEIETPIVVAAERADLPQGIVPEDIQHALVRSIYACPDGTIRVIPAIPDTVETSSNLAIITIGSGEVAIKILARSSCDSMKINVANSLESCFRLIGMKVERTGEYSGWQPNIHSSILQTMKVSYKKLFGVEPEVKVVHAGLECGIIGANIQGLDMISFGPTLRSPHSPDERVYIPSVTKFYDFLTATLEHIPVKE